MCIVNVKLNKKNKSQNNPTAIEKVKVLKMMLVRSNSSELKTHKNYCGCPLHVQWIVLSNH